MSTVGPAVMDGDGAALAVLLAALIVNAALAGLPGFRLALGAPEAALGAAVLWLDTHLNRAKRGAANRMIRGALAVVIVAGMAAVAGTYIGTVSATVSDGWIIEVAAVAALMVHRRALDLARAVRRALRRRGLDAARQALARGVSYDTSTLDGHALARAAIETCSVRFCDGVVAPAFWYLVLGLPGICVYRAVNAMAERIGHPTPRHAAFGMVASRLDRVLNILPAPLAGVVLALAAVFVPGASPARALRIMVRDSRNHGSPSVGWTASATAGALGLALAGPRHSADAVISGPWLGDGRARATAGDVGRAIYLFAVASLIVLAVLALLALGMTGG